MTLFWTISAAMIAVALALLAPTLLRQHAARKDASEQINIEIAREHLAELVKQKDAGDLSEEEYAQARKDLELALAEDLEGTAAPGPTARSGGSWALIAAVVLVPAITIPVYLEIGSPNLITNPPGQPQAAAGHGGQANTPPIDELVVQLRERMEANPDNAEGWFLLGRTYMRLQDYPGAVYAFEKVVELLPNETAAMLSLADAMAMRDGRQVGPRAVELLEKALSLDPNSVTALWLLGNAAFDKGNAASALEYWQRAYPLLAGEPQMQAELGGMITQAGGTPPAAAAALPPIMAASVEPDAQQAPRTAQSPAADAGKGEPGDAPTGTAINVEVALAPHLMEKAAPTDTVFVLARAQSGPPMPLAVSRHQVRELPLQVTLTDAMAMMPAMRLSAFPKVKISAKVSKSGQAGTKPGDLLAADAFVDSANAPDSVQLLINQIAE